MSEEEQVAAFVLPTRVAVQRYQQMKVEAVLNTPYQVTGEKTPLEFCLLESQDAEGTVKLLGLDEAMGELALGLLQDALQGGKVEEIYGARGGFLNVLMPLATPEQDHVWQAMSRHVEGAPTRSAFSIMPNELYSGMAPGHVWAGTGRIEMALAEAFLRHLWGEMKDKKFQTSGAANTEWLGRLRLWSYNPAQGYKGRVVDLILHERRDLLKRRLELCDQRGLRCEFAPTEF